MIDDVLVNHVIQQGCLCMYTVHGVAIYLHVLYILQLWMWSGLEYVNHSDLFDDVGTCKVAPEALQTWAPSDNKVFTGLSC